jgi:hypothetical protein
MGTKKHSNYSDLITFTRASGGTSLRPVSYGAELVTNGAGEFAGTDGTDVYTQYAEWSNQYNSTFTIQGNKGRFAPSGGFPAARLTLSGFVAGKVYLISAEAQASVSGKTMDISVNGTASTIVSNTSLQTNSHIFVSDGSTEQFTFTYDHNAGYVEFDNISVKEVTFDQADGTLTLFNHPNNIPRIDYDSDGNRLGLLVEESRTNLVTYSEDLNTFVKVSSTVEASSITSPDGGQNADQLKASATSAVVGAYYNFNASSASSYAMSVFAKQNTASILQVQAGGAAFGTAYANFDLSSGVAGSSSGVTTSMVDVGSGWYRCSVVVTATATAIGNMSIDLVSSTTAGRNDLFTGSVGDGIYIWGAQVETGSFPTSYIPTSGSTATRAADVASIPVADFGYNQSEGTLFVELQHFDPRTGSKIATGAGFGDGTTNNRMWYYQNKGQWIGVSGGVSQFGMTGSEPSENTPTKFAGVFKTNDFTAYIDGTSIGADSSGSAPQVPTLFIGYSGTTNSELNGHVKSIKYYPRRLSNAQLVEITS